MTRLQRTLSIAALALVGVGALTWILATSPSSSDRAKARYDAERPFLFGPDDVAYGTVTSTHGTFRFERHEVFGWRIAEPFSWPADAEPLEALLFRVAGLSKSREVYTSPSDTDLEQAGLMKPRVELALSLASGERHRLALGKIHPLESKVYARADDGAVFVAEPSVLWASLRPVDEFRKKRVLPFDRAKIDALGFRRSDGRRWTIRTGPTGFRVSIDEGPLHPADNGQVAVTMAAAFLRLEADRFLVDGAADLETALAQQGATRWKSAFSLSVRHQNGLVRTATVVVTKRDDGPQPLGWVDGSLVELYPPPAEELLKLNPLLLRDRSLADFDPAEVEKILLIYGLDFATLERSDGAWRLQLQAGPRADASPEPRPVSTDSVDDLLKRLARLEGADLAAEDPTPEQLSSWLIQPPSRRFGLQGAEGERLGVLTIGDLRGEDAFYVRGESGPVYVAPLKALDAIPLQLSDFGQ